jgi:hypothetical protein
MIGTIFLIWVGHAVIATLLSAPVVMLGRKRVHWQSWELMAFLLPFAFWLLLMVTPLATGRKSVSNLVEPLFFSLAVPAVALLRVVIGTRRSEKALACCLLALVCLGAVSSFFIVPCLPD